MKKLLLIALLIVGCSFGNTRDTISPSEVKESDISNKTKSFSLGLATNKSVNLLQISKDFRLTDNVKHFVYAGLPNLFGFGLTSQTNYNENGIIAALNFGIDVTGYGMGSLSVAYQWKLDKENSFFSLGLSLWSLSTGGSIPVTIPLPVLSYDFRF